MNRLLLTGLLLLFGSATFTSARAQQYVDTGMWSADLLRGGRVFASFPVLETSFTGDLNGDDDEDDTVLHVYDHATRLARNLGLAVRSFGGYHSQSPNHWVLGFGVSEADDGGRDLNGDGDAEDIVLHAYDHRTGHVTNLGVSSAPNRNVDSQGEVIHIRIHEHWEDEDLNGDGDAEDNFAFVYHVPAGRLSRLEGARYVDTWGDGDVLLEIPESTVGEDRNGDGDVEDSVMHVLDAATGEVISLELMSDVIHVEAVVDGKYVALAVSESAQGGKDLTGDGDTDDWVPHVVDLETRKARSIGIGCDPNRNGLGLQSGILVFAVPELGQKADLNGDGDLEDNVPHSYNVRTGFLGSTGFACGGPGSAYGDRHLVFVSEREHFGKDLDGDGDAIGSVPHVLTIGTGERTNLAFQSGAWTSLSGARTLVLTNNNGTLFEYDIVADEVRSLNRSLDRGIASSSPGARQLFRLGKPGDIYVYDGIRGKLQRMPSSRRRREFGVWAASPRRIVYGNRVKVIPDVCARGTVNARSGPVSDVLFVEGDSSEIHVDAGQQLTVELAHAPLGPAEDARYALWVWRADTTHPTDFGSEDFEWLLGCTVNPTATSYEPGPRPIYCVLGEEMSSEFYCGDSPVRSGRAYAPWNLSTRLSEPGTYVLQGVLEDSGASSPAGFSVTNAVVVHVDP